MDVYKPSVSVKYTHTISHIRGVCIAYNLSTVVGKVPVGATVVVPPRTYSTPFEVSAI